MNELTREYPEDNYAIWKNKDGDIVVDWNDDANVDYPEDLTSYRAIGDLISVVYKKGFSDGKIELQQQLSNAQADLELSLTAMKDVSAYYERLPYHERYTIQNTIEQTLRQIKEANEKENSN